MDINEAVEILNKHKWRERDDWRLRIFSETREPLCCYSDPDFPDDEDNIVGDRSIQLDPPDAIAIASYLQLREAVEPTINDLSGIVRLIESEMGKEGAERWGRVDLQGIIAEIYGRLAVPMMRLAQLTEQTK